MRSVARGLMFRIQLPESLLADLSKRLPETHLFSWSWEVILLQLCCTHLNSNQHQPTRFMILNEQSNHNSFSMGYNLTARWQIDGETEAKTLLILISGLVDLLEGHHVGNEGREDNG